MRFFIFALFLLIRFSGHCEAPRYLYELKPAHIFPTDDVIYYDSRVGSCFKGYWVPDDKGFYAVETHFIECDKGKGKKELPIWLTGELPTYKKNTFEYTRSSKENLLQMAFVNLPATFFVTAVNFAIDGFKKLNDSSLNPKL
jgi:hypothetical protein